MAKKNIVHRVWFSFYNDPGWRLEVLGCLHGCLCRCCIGTCWRTCSLFFYKLQLQHAAFAKSSTSPTRLLSLYFLTSFCTMTPTFINTLLFWVWRLASVGESPLKCHQQNVNVKLNYQNLSPSVSGFLKWETQKLRDAWWLSIVVCYNISG